MEDCEPKIILPNLWFNDPQNKTENMEVFQPKFNLPSNWIDDPQTKCYKNMDTGDTFAYSEELFCFIDPPADQTQSKDDDLVNIETRDISSATKEPCDIDDKATPAEKATHEGQKIHLMHLYHGNGPRIHRELSIEYGVANKRCEDCGKVGQLTCFSSSFRKWGRGGKQRKILHCGVCGK
ncbi:putative mitogen-activated protein kinase kinase kinase 1-like, partial [Sesbania bispinosa]